MGIDEADLPAQQPDRSSPPRDQPQQQQQQQQEGNTSGSGGGGGLLEAPRPPVVTTPGVVNVRQQPPTFTLTKNKAKENEEQQQQQVNESSSSLLLQESSKQDSSCAVSTTVSECAPSRQSSVKQQQQEDDSATTSTNTTITRPGVYAVPGMIGSSTTTTTTSSSSSNYAANASNLTSSMASNFTSNTNTTTTTATSNTVTTRESAESTTQPLPPTTIITATKVNEEDDENSPKHVHEAVRLAQEEAEQLRQQVRSLQQERNATTQPPSAQVLVVATAAPKEEEEDEEESSQELREQEKRQQQQKCLWIACLILTCLGVLVGGGIAIYLTLFAKEDDAVVVTMAPTTSPSMAPTIPCLTTITPADTQGRLKPLLEVCQGDCNVDDDCVDDLVCFHRNGPYDPVPGCACWESDNTRNDYCILPQTDPCLVETNDYPLGMCEGNCENDGDCQLGLTCMGIHPDDDTSAKGCQFCKEQDDQGNNNDFVTGFVPPGVVPDDGNINNNDTQVWNLIGNQTNGTANDDGGNFTFGLFPNDPDDNGGNNYTIGLVPNNDDDPPASNSNGNNETEPSILPVIDDNNIPSDQEFVTSIITNNDNNEDDMTTSTTTTEENENGRRALLEKQDESSSGYYTGDPSDAIDVIVSRPPKPFMEDNGLNEEGDTTKPPTKDDTYGELIRDPTGDWTPVTRAPTKDMIPVDDDDAGQDLPAPPKVRYCVLPPDNGFSTINVDGDGANNSDTGLKEDDEGLGQRQPGVPGDGILAASGGTRLVVVGWWFHNGILFLALLVIPLVLLSW